jgi:hypothetical protein
MHHSVNRLLFLWVTLLSGHVSFAGEHFSFRKLLSRVRTNVSLGYGRSWYSYEVGQHAQARKDAVVVFQEGDKFYINAEKPGTVYLIQWFHGPYVCMKSYVRPQDLPNNKKIIARAKFTGEGSTLPIVLSLHTDFWRKMRVGLGGALFMHTLEYLVHEGRDDEETIGNYTPIKNRYYHVRPFVMLGFKFVDHATWSILLDSHFGVDLPFAAAAWHSMHILNLGVQDIGITIERKVSEHFRLFGRLSYERFNPLDTFDDSSSPAALERSSILLQLGLSFHYPEIPRCTLPGCKVERKHKHVGKTYRGTSIFTGRDAQGRRLCEQ